MMKSVMSFLEPGLAVSMMVLVASRILGSSWLMGVWEKSPNTRMSVRLKRVSSSLRQAAIWGLIPYRFW